MPVPTVYQVCRVKLGGQCLTEQLTLSNGEVEPEVLASNIATSLAVAAFRQRHIRGVPGRSPPGNVTRQPQREQLPVDSCLQFSPGLAGVKKRRNSEPLVVSGDDYE
jgi:hypothetical protein